MRIEPQGQEEPHFFFGFGGIAQHRVDTAHQIVRRGQLGVALNRLFAVGESAEDIGGVELELGELVVSEAEARIELENALQGGLRAVGIGTIRVSEAEQVGDLSICRVLSGSLVEVGEGGGIVAGFEIGIAKKRVGERDTAGVRTSTAS